MRPCWGAELSGLLATGCGGRLLHRRLDLDLRMAWRLRVLPVCASTEPLLSNWLAAQPLLPIAVVSKKQRFGRGTAQRHWQSPAGGLWLSAAIPWGGEPPAADRLPLLMAAALMAELEPLGLGAELHLKPPNDLMVGQQKLAGVLTSVVWRAGRCATCALALASMAAIQSVLRASPLNNCLVTAAPPGLNWCT